MSILPLLRSTACLGMLASASAVDATTAGTPTAPGPTPYGIALVWPFSGDADGDGKVAVRYRATGGAWKQGMPLFRVAAGTLAGHSWSNAHRGSLFDLVPATTYEVELTLADPDGGSAVRTLSVGTRALPRDMAGAPVKAVTPATFATVAAGAAPGDILLLGAGTYAGFSWSRDGEATRPIVLRSTAGAVVDGSIDLIARSYVHLDGLAVAGRVRFNGSRGIAVERCTVRARADRGNGDAIVSYLRSEDAFIADNTVIGTTVWRESSLGTDGDNLGEGICVSGPGHVLRNNRVRGFRDGLSLMEDDEAADQYGIDILDNDISECADDGIEADFAAHNVRVLRNRLTNCFIGLSSQPGLGGPTYFVRNVLYNIAHVPFKLYRNSHGDVLVNNTVVKNGDAFAASPGTPIVGLWTRNNLFIGGPGGTWNGYSGGTDRVMGLYDLDTASASLDHDGYGSASGTFTGRFGSAVTFSGLAQLRSLTSEAHAVQVDLGVFAAPVAHPAAAMTTFAPPDLRLASASAAIDAGVAIPGLTDGFAGSAPDLGAYEAGAALPVYGPRSPAEPDPDLTPPVISGLRISAITNSGATIAWSTDEAADTQVEYGLTATYGTATTLAPALTTSHSVVLTGLAAGTSYHVRVRARDAAGNLGLSPDATFTAASGGSGPGDGGAAGASDAGDGGGGCGLGASGTALLLAAAAFRSRRTSGKR